MNSPPDPASRAPALALRLARAEDQEFLTAMLLLASGLHEQPGARREHVLSTPALARYVVGFGRAGDLGVIGEVAGRPVGAAWVRLLGGDDRGYGWVDDATPELSVAVEPQHVRRGVGSSLIRELLAQARRRFPGVSLSVRRDNPACRLYLRLGFLPVEREAADRGSVSETLLIRF